MADGADKKSNLQATVEYLEQLARLAGEDPKDMPEINDLRVMIRKLEAK